jgi:predicted phage terminase large subunit-like protein
MATARKSTKAGGRVCALCRHEKSVTDFPSSTATVCIDCSNEEAALAEFVEQSPKRRGRRSKGDTPPVAPSDVTAPDALPAELTAEVPVTDPDPFVDPGDPVDFNTPSVQELAARTLARRKLLHFIKRFRPKYMAGWVHEDICRRLERFMRDVELGKEPRLLLMMPVRMGKSEISSRHFAPWVLGQHPDWEIIAASGAQSLAVSFSRYIRDLVRSDSYQALFPEMKLDPQSASVENWNTTSGGGYLAAGVGTMITGRGAHCVVPYCGVNTIRGIIPASKLRVGDTVYGYDHETGEQVETTILAVSATVRAKPLVAIENGPVVTTDHGVFNHERGVYQDASLSNGMSTLWFSESSARPVVLGVLCKEQGISAHRANLRVLRKGIQPSESGAPEELGQGRGGRKNILWGRVLSQVQARESHPVQQGEGRVPALWRTVSRIQQEQVLFEGVLQRVSRYAQGFGGVFRCVLGLESTRVSEAQGLHPLRPTTLAERGASHRRQCREQQPWELDGTLHVVPQEVSSVHGTSAEALARLLPSDDYVVDIQTGTGNFFAGCLLHNCLIVDDAVRDSESADSQVIRDNVWEWYISTALSRLAPGGGVLVIMTHWNEDDLAGRLQALTAMGDGDVFEIVKYPAINDQGDEYILADDSIAQFPEGSTIPVGARLTRPHNTALHPERYTFEALMRRKATYFALGQQRWWHALYQQSPTVDDGVFFTKEMFRFYTAEPHPLERAVYQAWDFAITEGSLNDYTVGSTGLQDRDNNLHIAEVRRFKSSDSFIIVDAILDMWVEHGSCALIGFEDGQIWKTLKAVFVRRCEERGLYPSYELLVPLTDKAARAQPLRGLMQGGKVWFKNNAPWFEEVRKEFTQFLSGGKHDDTVDSCFVAGTPVRMGDGSQRCIEDVRVGEFVDTPYGPRQVLDAQRTADEAQVYEVVLSDGRTLVGTVEHPVSTERGWVRLGNLTESDKIHVRVSITEELPCRESTRKQHLTSNVSSSTENSIAATLIRRWRTYAATSVAQVGADFCTATFGSSTTDLFRRVASFITRMRTASTTRLKTSSASLPSSITSIGTRSRLNGRRLLNSLLTSSASATKPLSGTALRRAEPGTASTPRPHGRSANLSSSSANSAALSLNRSVPTPDTAEDIARTKPGTSHTLNMVRRSALERRRAVYNLTVDDVECFYANDVLVHNCAWLVRLSLNHRAPAAPAPKKMKSWKDQLRGLVRGAAGHMSACISNVIGYTLRQILGRAP